MALSTTPSPVTAPPVQSPPAAPHPPGARLVTGLALLAALATLGIDLFGLDAARTAELAVLTAALGGAVAWLLAGAIAPAAPKLAWIALALLTLLGLWAGLSLLWSVAPGESWRWVNRALTSALVVLLAFACGASTGRAAERLGAGLLVAITLTAVSALAGRVLPGVFDDGLATARLAGPPGDPAALGLLCAIGVPLALAVAADPARRAAWRLASLAALWVQLVTLALAASRGAVVAAVIGVLLLAWLRGPGGALIGWLGAAVLAAVPVYVLALTRPGLGENDASPAVRADDGLLLLGVLGVALVAVLALGWALLLRQRRPPGARHLSGPAVRRLVMVAAAVAALVVIALAAQGEGGLRGTLERLRDDVLDDPPAVLSEPGRLGSVNADRRWDLWQEAAGMFSDRPVQGFGMGSFANEHLRYRTDDRLAISAQSVPMTLLAEAGAIGTLLGVGGLLLLMVAAIQRVRELDYGQQRLSAAALAAGGTAWVAAGAWQTTLLQPAVTIPGLLMLGTVAALSRDPELARRRRAIGLGDPGEPVRVLFLLAGVLALAGLSLSVVLPARAALKARAAVTLEPSAPEARQQAAALDAAVASRLDPLSSVGPIAEATVAVRRGRLAQARNSALEAVRRTPENVAAWTVLAVVARAQADRAGFTLAAERALSLNPRGPRSRALAADAAEFEAPPAGSPTATGTPLTGAQSTVAPVPTPTTTAPSEPALPEPTAPAGAAPPTAPAPPAPPAPAAPLAPLP